MNVSDLYNIFKTCSGVSTDTRKIEANSMFFALKGDKFNANELAQSALENGAKYAVIDEEKYKLDDRFIVVNNVLETLQTLANYHRKTFNFPVLALTGSNGKTTTKELIAAVLSKKFKTYATVGNLNNHIGVPLTLLAIDNSCQIAVIEMGANHQKEIHNLCHIAEPTHGLITNVGKAHLEGFGGLEGIKKGKGELYDYLEQTRGTVFVNATSDVLLEMSQEHYFKEKIYYLIDSDPLKMTQDSPFVSYQFSDITPPIEVKTQLAGKYNFENIAAAIAVGKYFGISPDQSNAAIATYKPDNNRSQIIEKGTNTIILDAYNANPSSMAASVNNFIALKTDKQKIVILGDMLELGEDAPAEHLALGKLTAQGNFDCIILYGNLIQHALPALPKAYYFSDKFSLHNWLSDKAFQDAYFLIKGSRGVSLETSLNFISANQL